MTDHEKKPGSHEDEAGGDGGENNKAGGAEEGSGSRGDHGSNFVAITVVVNGQPVVIEAVEQQPLHVVRQKALAETKNLAQPPENWEMKNEAGDLLDPDKKVGEFGFGKEVTLFLSLKAGVAGV